MRRARFARAVERVGTPPERASVGEALWFDVRGLEDLARLPVVTKEELREDQQRHPPFGTFAVADQADFREWAGAMIHHGDGP